MVINVQVIKVIMVQKHVGNLIDLSYNHSINNVWKEIRSSLIHGINCYK